MTTALQPYQKATGLAGITLANAIMTQARHARQANRALTPAGYFGLVAADTLRSGRGVHELPLLLAAKDELLLRYGAEIPRLVVLGYSDYAIAVAFEGQLLARRPGDPVDVLVPWTCTLPLAPLQKMVEEMLNMDASSIVTAKSLLIELRKYTKALADWRWPDVRTQALFSKVVASNMTLILRLFGTQASNGI